MATYVNDLRLKEIATGDEAGTWGTSTNTNLELIGEALGYGTQDCFSSDADATTTVADGTTDPARAMYFKVTSSATLTATRTLTIAPNTISRVMFIENATTGSQSITISQGTGANVTIATGKTAVVYLDGAGSGAAVVDAMALVDPGITDTLAEVLVAGNTTGGTSLVVSSGDDVTFTGASANIVFDSSDSALEFADNAKAIFGAGSDLQIYHDGTGSYIEENGTGNLFIEATNLRIKSASGENYIAADQDGAVQLYYDNSAKLATFSGGVSVTGTVASDGLSMGDGDIATFGNSNDLQIYHNANNSYVQDVGTGKLHITSDGTGVSIDKGTSELMATFDVDGAVTLYHNNAAKLATTSTGIDVTGTAVTDGLTSAVTDGSSFAANFNHTGGSVGRNGIKITSSGTSGTSTLIEALRNTTNTVFKVDGSGNLILNDQSGNQNHILNVTGAAVFNDQGADADFRVESDTNSHFLFVDAGNNRVNIGTTDVSSQGTLAVNGSAIFGRSSTTTGDFISSGGGNNRHL